MEEGRRGNQTREHLRRKRPAVILVLLFPSSVKWRPVLLAPSSLLHSSIPPSFRQDFHYQKTALILPQIERKVLIVFMYHICCSPRLRLSFSLSLGKKRNLGPCFLPFAMAEGFACLRSLHLISIRRTGISEIPVLVVGLIWCFSPLKTTQSQMKSIRER